MTQLKAAVYRPDLSIEAFDGHHAALANNLARTDDGPKDDVRGGRARKPLRWQKGVAMKKRR